MSVTTLENIANSMALRKGEDEQNKLRYLMFARDGVRELSINVDRPLSSIELEFEDDMTVILPDDYVGHSKIGICICGHIVELDEDNRLCVGFKKDDFCDTEGNEIAPETIFQDTCECISGHGEFPDYYENQYDWGNIYRNGAAQSYPSVPAHRSIGCYRRKGNRLYFDSICPKNATIVMEYYSNGLSITDITYIDDVIAPAVISYIRWQNELEKRGNFVNQYQAEYERQYRLFKNYKMRSPIADLYKAVRRNRYQGKISR